MSVPQVLHCLRGSSGGFQIRFHIWIYWKTLGRSKHLRNALESQSLDKQEKKIPVSAIGVWLPFHLQNKRQLEILKKKAEGTSRTHPNLIIPPMVLNRGSLPSRALYCSNINCWFSKDRKVSCHARTKLFQMLRNGAVIYNINHPPLSLNVGNIQEVRSSQRSRHCGGRLFRKYSLESEKRTRMWKLSVKRVSETWQLASKNLSEGRGIFRKDMDIFGSIEAYLRSRSYSGLTGTLAKVIKVQCSFLAPF